MSTFFVLIKSTRSVIEPTMKVAAEAVSGWKASASWQSIDWQLGRLEAGLAV